MSAEDERKLFVAGLSDTTSETELRAMFEQIGATIEELSIPRDRATGAVRGFAFLTLGSGDEAEMAISRLNGMVVGEGTLTVRPFRSERGGAPPARGQHGAGGGPSQRPPPPAEDSTLYVGNLPFEADQAGLTEYFTNAGFAGVRRIHLPSDQDGRKRGFGFVTLKDAEEAKGAAEALDGAEFGGRNLSVNIARRGGGPPRGDARSARPPRPGGPPGGGPPRRPSLSPGGPSPSLRPPSGARPSGGFGGGGSGPPPMPEEGRRDGGRREKRKEKKRKGRGLSPERGGRRRRDEGFSPSKIRGAREDWDEE